MAGTGERLRDLPGLGPVSERRLHAIGIRTRADLERTGPVQAFMMLRAAGGPPPSLNFLYAMVGALAGVPWTRIAREEKARWLNELEGALALRRPSGAPPPRGC